jgi:Development and cell death domain
MVEPGFMQVAIFLTNKATVGECLEKGLFGTSAAYGKAVREGDLLLLYNFSARQLYGVWSAASDGGTFDPGAWGGDYRNQVRVSLASREMVGVPGYCLEYMLGEDKKWGRLLTGSKGHNLLQYFAFDYSGEIGMGLPLHETEREYRRQHPASFVSGDGHRVRFKEEKIIDDCLHVMQVPHAYELVIAFPPAQLVPTFVVHRKSGEPVYVEVVSDAYASGCEERMQRKNSIYAEHRLPVMELFPDDLRSVGTSLLKKLAAFKVAL